MLGFGKKRPREYPEFGTTDEDGTSKAGTRFGMWGKRVHNPGATVLSGCCNAPMYLLDGSRYCSHCRRTT